MPAKLLGVALLLAGLLLRHRIRRARRLGYVGPRYRRVHREVDRAKFNATLPGRLTDARSPDDGCWYFFRDGEKLMRSTSIEPQARPQAEVVRIQ